MAETSVQIPPSSTGSAIDLWQVTATINGVSGPVNRQGIVVADPTTAANVQAVKAGGTLSSAALDGASVVTVRDAVAISNPVTAQPVGAGAFNAAATSVTGVSGAATQILPARTGAPGTGRIKMMLTNSGSQTVTIGNAVTMTSGYPLLAAQTIQVEAQSAIWGYVASGSASVSYIEIF